MWDQIDTCIEIKGDLSDEFTKTQKLPSKIFYILLSMDSSMAGTLNLVCNKQAQIDFEKLSDLLIYTC